MESDREARVRAIVRLLLRKGELEVDDQHPILDSGLTVPQMRVLFCAARRGGARPGFIAERTRMAPPNVTSVLDRLAERRLVRREPDAEDGRATIVLLTEDGKRLVREMAAAHSGRLEGAIEGMDPAELDALEIGLRALVREMAARMPPLGDR
ncbi:MAG: MarR family transcriptional regulator [Dehalococcoidia bacterium]